MTIKPIKTEKDYEKALDRIEKIHNAKPNTKESDELEVLLILVENYEEKHYFIDAPTPIEAIKFRMEQEDLKQKDLVNALGDKSIVSKILNGKRELSVDMIRKLHSMFNIPFESLLLKA